jgi:hypothetical protein
LHLQYSDFASWQRQWSAVMISSVSSLIDPLA